MANIAQMVNVLQAMILTDRAKMVLTPTYHVFEMYRRSRARATPRRRSTRAPDYGLGEAKLPAVSASASKDKAGKLSLVNIDPPADHNHLHPRGRRGQRGQGPDPHGPGMNTHNTFAAPNRVHPTAVELTGAKGGVDLTPSPGASWSWRSTSRATAPSRAQPRRYAPGVTPVRSLKTLVRCACVAKPQAEAMSARESFASRSIALARSTRRRSTYWYGLSPKLRLNRREKWSLL